MPVNAYTYMYINGLLELLNDTMGVFVVDERESFRPAGLAKLGKNRGGHLQDAPHARCTLTIERIESLLHSVVMVEQGMILRYPVGLEHDGEVLLKSYCPPYFPSMEAAVHAVVETKFGANGIFRGGVGHSSWSDPNTIAAAANPLTDSAIAATIAYCNYVYATYGRFPAYPAPFRTSIGFQAAHLDLSFYDRFYRPEALSETQRRHDERWHSTSE